MGDLELRTPSGWSLRPWAVADAKDLEVSLDPEDAQRQLGRVLTTREKAVRWIDERQTEWAAGTAYSWAVQSPDGLVIGSVAVSAVNRIHDTGWVSYWTATHARGQGVAGEATVQVANWAIAGLGLFRLELGHRTNNPASCRVATAAGFRVEGIERAKLRYGDRRYDVELHARLATDEPADLLDHSR